MQPFREWEFNIQIVSLKLTEKALNAQFDVKSSELSRFLVQGSDCPFSHLREAMSHAWTGYNAAAGLFTDVRKGPVFHLLPGMSGAAGDADAFRLLRNGPSGASSAP